MAVLSVKLRFRDSVFEPRDRVMMVELIDGGQP